MFYDLNIPVPDESNADSFLNQIIERLFKYGYRGVALTKEVDESIFDKNKKDKESKKKITGNAEPNNLLPPPFDLSSLKKKFSKIHFYSRINITIGDSGNIRKFTQSKNLKKYDIISIRPLNQNVLKSLSSIAEVDIISYNPESKCTLSLSRKLYKQLVNQNVYFELTYSPAIIDSTARKNLLLLAHIYRAIGKSKNIIVSSGAQSAPYVRGPYDVINFNLLFGLSEEQSKSSISRTCEKLLLRARKQRRSKSTIEMIQNEKLNEITVATDLTKEDTKTTSK